MRLGERVPASEREGVRDEARLRWREDEVRALDAPLVEALGRVAPVPALVLGDGLGEGRALARLEVLPLLLGPLHHGRDRVRLALLERQPAVGADGRQVLGAERVHELLALDGHEALAVEEVAARAADAPGKRSLRVRAVPPDGVGGSLRDVGPDGALDAQLDRLGRRRGRVREVAQEDEDEADDGEDRAAPAEEVDWAQDEGAHEDEGPTGGSACAAAALGVERAGREGRALAVRRQRARLLAGVAPCAARVVAAAEPDPTQQAGPAAIGRARVGWTGRALAAVSRGGRPCAAEARGGREPRRGRKVAQEGRRRDGDVLGARCCG